YARQGDHDALLAEDRSVASGRAMEEIAAGKGRAPKPFMLPPDTKAEANAVWHSNRGDFEGGGSGGASAAVAGGGASASAAGAGRGDGAGAAGGGASGYIRRSSGPSAGTDASTANSSGSASGARTMPGSR